MFRIFFSFLLITASTGCLPKSGKSSAVELINNSIAIEDDTISEMPPQIQKTLWKTVDYKRNENFPSRYDDTYAAEVSKFLTFSISQDTLLMENCKVDIYTYKQKTELDRYDSESIFLAAYPAQKEYVEFITTMGDIDKSPCFPFDELLFYSLSKSKLIFFDRGYFFEFEPSNGIRFPDYIKKLDGVPGNNRAEWMVEFEVNQISDYIQALAFFKKEFPYGGKGLDLNWEENSAENKQKSLIEYTQTKNKLLITKADPMGTITIEFELENQSLLGKYQFQLPEY